jgi:hypothetical protein
MNVDDNDKLWELLGKTRPPAVSPFFSRNVLRAIRQEEAASGSFLVRLRRFLTRSLRRWVWRFALTGACAIAAFAAVSTLVPGLPSTFIRHHHTAEVQNGLARQIVGNPDYEVIKHLDELVADEESSLWLDDSVH